MNQKQIRAAVEAMLFAAADPISADKLAQAVQLPQASVEAALEDPAHPLPAGGQRLVPAPSGYPAGSSRPKRNGPIVSAACWMPAARYRWGPAAMETLTVIAYNQPVSRAFIEQVRGVDSSSSVTSLLEKGLIEEAGRLDLPGRPVSFRTTDVFLRCFGLSSLADLPPVHSAEDETTKTEEANE